MDVIVLYFVAFISACVVSLLLIPGILALAHRNRWYDKIDDRKIHNTDTPRLGGMGMFAGFILVGIVATIVAHSQFATGDAPLPVVSLMALAAGVVLIHVVGLVDDFTNIRARAKLIGQILAAAVVTAGGFTIRHITLPGLSVSIDLGIFAYPVTVVWIITLSNALNLVDGLDGYAGGIAANAALFYGVLATINGNLNQAVLSFVLLGAILGFLTFNFPPARIFMGDSGSLFLGFVLAVIPLIPGPGHRNNLPLLAPISLLIIPILDTIYAIVRRRREGRPFYSPDRGHLHHKLLDLGIAPRNILAIVYAYCFVMGLSVLLITGLMSPWAMAWIAGLWIVAAIIFFIPAWLYKKRMG